MTSTSSPADSNICLTSPGALSNPMPCAEMLGCRTKVHQHRNALVQVVLDVGVYVLHGSLPGILLFFESTLDGSVCKHSELSGKALMIIDSHAHIYSEDLETYPTIADPLRPPPGTGTPSGLQEAMRSCGVDRAMLVQTTTFYEWDNTFVRDVGAGV